MDREVAVAEEDDVVDKKEVVGVEFSGCSRISSLSACRLLESFWDFGEEGVLKWLVGGESSVGLEGRGSSWGPIGLGWFGGEVLIGFKGGKVSGVSGVFLGIWAALDGGWTIFREFLESAKTSLWD